MYLGRGAGTRAVWPRSIRIALGVAEAQGFELTSFSATAIPCRTPSPVTRSIHCDRSGFFALVQVHSPPNANTQRLAQLFVRRGYLPRWTLSDEVSWERRLESTRAAIAELGELARLPVHPSSRVRKSAKGVGVRRVRGDGLRRVMHAALTSSLHWELVSMSMRLRLQSRRPATDAELVLFIRERGITVALRATTPALVEAEKDALRSAGFAFRRSARGLLATRKLASGREDLLRAAIRVATGAIRRGPSAKLTRGG